MRPLIHTKGYYWSTQYQKRLRFLCRKWDRNRWDNSFHISDMSQGWLDARSNQGQASTLSTSTPKTPTCLGRVRAGFPVTGPDAIRFGSLPPIWGKNIQHPLLVIEAFSVAFPYTNLESFAVSALGLFHRMLAVLVKNHWWVENVSLKNIQHPRPRSSPLLLDFVLP